jgi:phosphate transport system permease protein
MTRLKNSDKKERSIQIFLLFMAFVAVIIVFLIIIYLIQEAFPFYKSYNLIDFLTGLVWQPPVALGALPIILGTLLIALGAMIIALPLGLGCAIFIAFVAPKKVRVFMKSAVELLAGVPSVVFGYFGVQIIVPWVRRNFSTAGPSLFAAALLVGFISLPVVVSVMEDALTSVSQDLWEASMGMGATKWETISRVTIPSSFSGLAAAAILGVGRAIGETMAVVMVCGNSNGIPLTFYDLFKPINAITSTIALEMGESFGSGLEHALFALAVVLMIMVLAIDTVSYLIALRVKRKMRGSTGPATKMFSQGRKIYKVVVACILALVSVAVLEYAFVRTSIADALAGATLAGIAVCANSILVDRASKKTNRDAVVTSAFLSYTILVIIFALLDVNFGVTIALATIVVISAIWIFYRFLPRLVNQYVAYILITLACAVVLFFLGFIIYVITSNGIRVVNWQFLSSMPTGNGKGGGIFSAIVGTLELVGGALVLAVPIGICAAIYLNEYARDNILKKIIRLGVDNLNGMPSIVFGLFGYAFLVVIIFHAYCLIAGQITLGLMVLPTIIRTTEESLATVPQSLREASLALGATKWQTITQVVLPVSAPGTLTGVILSIGRAAGETAPILWTCCAFSRFLAQSEFQPVMALSYQIYSLFIAYPNSVAQAYGVAFVLLVVVLSMYAIAIILRYYYHNKIKI